MFRDFDVSVAMKFQPASTRTVRRPGLNVAMKSSNNFSSSKLRLRTHLLFTMHLKLNLTLDILWFFDIVNLYNIFSDTVNKLFMHYYITAITAYFTRTYSFLRLTRKSRVYFLQKRNDARQPACPGGVLMACLGNEMHSRSASTRVHCDKR